MTVLRFKVNKKDLDTVKNGGSIIKSWTVGNIDINVSLESGIE